MPTFSTKNVLYIMKPLQNTQGLSSNHAAQLAKNFIK